MIPVPLTWVLIGLLACGGGGFLYGMHVADQSAEVDTLTDKLKTANATVAAKTAEAKANAAVTAAFSQRAIGDAQTFQSQIQEPVDEIVTHEEARPPADVCRLDGGSYEQLLDLARRAGLPQANPAGRP
jgi:hypothetical protein